ncbi:MAG TPA: 4-(cytidine 5'-diphospho)-2-C-methyl-D-erythritol kinase [Dyella sp.]|uniref:4-(cytidine 5'-diphospho)-2-C-methyl-D-erythritol kinase n=1 Tax=Dyella sp. TaxID=1869338 RepID=UPI002C71873C|nr:4-(cytidine 5'-diphospho)-2-C-methyl-D-erythritol kinase [Dyella sp.]HTV87117.1 4-(cytidine 5'-diphospho)-2-C-methyl-D-erythritol kinase [Dyella sp.]
MNFRIERAVTAHVHALCAIERAAVQMFRGHAAWPFYASMAIPPELLEEAIQRGLVWVALDDVRDEPVGFIWLDTEHGGDVVGIAEIDVLPDCSRRGIGAALLQRACEWARAAGYRRVDLGTLADVPWNMPFYARHGFTVVDKHDPAFAYARDRDRENGFPDALRVFMSRPLSAPAASEWSVWPAPAKLSLFLRITGQRADGCDELQTVFRMLDWGDEIRLRVRTGGAVQLLNSVAGVPAEQNLLLRAANVLRAHARVEAGVDIEIDKRIPIGAGLGGGASDAATVLVALNQLWHCNAGIDELATLARSLRADVPVFVLQRSAWVSGTGEHFKPISLPRRWYVLVDPHERTSAVELFQTAELTRNAPPATISSFASGETLENAFEPLVRARYPRVAAALDWLGHHGHARLSGSGGCVFLETATVEQAEAVAGRCPAAFTAWVAQGVGRSPLHQALLRHGAAG